MERVPHILIAEDNPKDFDTLTAILRARLGEFRTTETPVCTTSTCCAYLAARNWPWDLVIYDPHLLDKKNGKGLEDVVRAAHAKAIPVIVLSAEDLELLEADDYEAVTEAEGYFDKGTVFSHPEGSFADAVKNLILRRA